MIKDRINIQGSTLENLKDGFCLYLTSERGRGFEVKMTAREKEKSTSGGTKE
jgi:hypothetical protein